LIIFSINAQNVALSGMTMVKTTHKTGPWNLTDLKDIEPNGYKVFSCFHCGGGSTMGYKLSGFEVLGGVEIDPEMMKIYKANHNPKHSFLMGVQEFNKIPRDKLPEDLFNLDILDGSPPCSSFSMAGSREKAWGKNKKFREGQAVQVLDDLFFHFIDMARKLQPKIVVAENVKGLVMGKAKGYVKEIAQMFNLAGYDLQLFLLNAAFMGVPQRRERTFFIAKKKSLKLPKLVLGFDERPIPVSSAFIGTIERGKSFSNSINSKYWDKAKPGESFSKHHPTGSLFNLIKLPKDAPAPTVIGSSISGLFHFSEKRFLSDQEFIRLQSFPDDYQFLSTKGGYVTGMSVPPYMMNRVSKQIQLQWLDVLSK
jgi:DNA (cytosine-5)-methyltransferase 1